MSSLRGGSSRSREEEAHLQSVESPSVQEDGEADKVAVLGYNV